MEPIERNAVLQAAQPARPWPPLIGARLQLTDEGDPTNRGTPPPAPPTAELPRMGKGTLPPLREHQMTLWAPWEVHVAVESQRAFYWNPKTGVTQWAYPWNHLLAKGIQRHLDVHNRETFGDGVGYYFTNPPIRLNLDLDQPPPPDDDEEPDRSYRFEFYKRDDGTHLTSKLALQQFATLYDHDSTYRATIEEALTSLRSVHPRQHLFYQWRSHTTATIEICDELLRSQPRPQRWCAERMIQLIDIMRDLSWYHRGATYVPPPNAPPPDITRNAHLPQPALPGRICAEPSRAA